MLHPPLFLPFHSCTPRHIFANCDIHCQAPYGNVRSRVLYPKYFFVASQEGVRTSFTLSCRFKSICLKYLHHLQAAAASAYQRIVPAREAATSGGSSSSVDQAPDDSSERDSQSEQASPADAASRPKPSAAGHTELAQLLSAAGDAQAALEEQQQHATMLEASATAIRIAEVFTSPIRSSLILARYYCSISAIKSFCSRRYGRLGKA